MARRHVIKYYKEVQDQYIEMLHQANEFEKALKDEFITQEQITQYKEIVAKLKENYERLSYIMFLLNMPNKKSKEAHYKKQNKNIVNYLNNSSEEFVLKEDEDVLLKLRQFIKKELEELKNDHRWNFKNI